MTFTIEPALSEGTDEIVILEDGWTAVTCDNSRAAQCEHTVLITATGVEILTKQMNHNRLPRTQKTREVKHVAKIREMIRKFSVM